jgi:hypothetical protein
MAQSPKDHNQVYASLAALRAEEAALVPQVEALPLVQRLNAVRGAIIALENYATASRQRTGASDRKISTQGDGPFAGLSLPQAATKQLELAGKPQTAKEIWDALSDGGVTLTSKDPVRAVDWSLRRRGSKGARLKYSAGKWSFVLPDPDKGGMINRDRDAHIESTKAGIAHFKARTGATWGRRPVITAEQIGKFRELYDSGNYKVIAATKEAGMSNAYFYMHREAILAWRKGDPWPPPPKQEIPRGVSGDELRAMGIIPMHARLVGEDK